MGKHARTKRERFQNVKALDKTIYSNQNNPFVVVTPLGSTIINPNDLLYVSLGGQNFCEKPAKDLTKGDQVIFEKNGIDINAQRIKINDLLLEGKIYRSAFEKVFARIEQPHEGNPHVRPRFLHELIRGMIEYPDIWGPPISNERLALESIFQSGGLLPLAIRTAAAESIYEKLAGAISSRTFDLERIQGKWLTGQIIAPKNFQEIFIALSDHAPSLTDLIATNHFKQNYDFYLIARQSIFTRLSNIIKGKSSARPRTHTRNENQNILTNDVRNELSLVVSYFGEEISATHALTSVVDILPIVRASETSPTEITSENPLSLKRGIVTNRDPNSKPHNLVSFDVTQKRKVALGALYDHLIDIYASFAVQNNMYNGQFILSGILFCDRLFESLGHPGYIDKFLQAEETARKIGLPTADFSPFYSPRYRSDVENASKFYRTLLNCALDLRIGISKGACLEIVRQYATYSSNVPQDLIYIRYLESLRQELLLEGKAIPALDTLIAEVIKKIKMQNRHIYVPLKITLQNLLEENELLCRVMTREKLTTLDQIVRVSQGSLSIENDDIFNRLKPLLGTKGIKIPISDIITNKESYEIYQDLGISQHVSAIDDRWLVDQKVQFINRPDITKILTRLPFKS